MRPRRKRRAVPGDVAVVRVHEEDRGFRGRAYHVAIVIAVDALGAPTAYQTGAGEMPAAFALDYWTEPAEKYDVVRMRRRLERDPPERMLRLGSVRWFLERYLAPTPTERAPPARPAPAVPPSIDRRLVSVTIARRLRELGAPAIAATFWCRREGARHYVLQRWTSGCTDALPAYNVREMLTLLPDPFVVDGEAYELDVEVTSDGYQASYVGLHAASATKLADALGVLAIYRLEKQGKVS